MSNLILRVLTRSRNAFRRVGIQPPYWLIQLGRRLHVKYYRIAPPHIPQASQTLQVPQVPHASYDRQNVSQLEAKVDRLLWTLERIEATLYLQSLQPSIQTVPLQTKPPAGVDASAQP